MGTLFEPAGNAVSESPDFTSRQLRGGTLMQAVLCRSPNVDVLRKLLRMGYQAARWTSAGLAISPDTQDLLLTQWFEQTPDMDSPERREAAFLQSLDIWRTAIGRVESLERTDSRVERAETGVLEARVREQLLRPDRPRR